MKTPSWRRYLRFWRDDVIADVDDELRFHVNMRIEEYVAAGMSFDDARNEVLRRLGDLDAARAECIDLNRVRAADSSQARFLDALRNDLRYAVRSLRRTPVWTAVALTTIALGTGATTAVFRTVETLVIHPFNYPNESRVFIARRDFSVDGNTIPVPLPIEIVREWRQSARSVEAAAPYAPAAITRLRGDAAELPVTGVRVDTAFLPFAGAHPIIGRNFAADEILDGGPDVVLLTEQLWRRQFGASPQVIGSRVEFDVMSPPGPPGAPLSSSRAFTVIGVVPASAVIPDFRSDRPDVLLPLKDSPQQRASVLVRLKSGVSRSAAAAELDGILKRAHLDDLRPAPGDMPVHLTRPGDWLAIRQPLLMLTAAVALLMLVACTNVAHLLLARGTARESELAMRHALGASRARLVRQLVTESLVLAVGGGVLALAVGWAALRGLAAVRPATMLALSYVSGNRDLLPLAGALAIGTGMVVGLLTAVRTAHRQLSRTLYAGAWSTIRGGRRLRSTLVISEVALSATLLVGALLLVRSVRELERTDLGFDPRNLYEVTLPTNDGHAAVLADQALGRARSMPDVESATLANAAFGPHSWRFLTLLETPGHERRLEDIPMLASWSTGLFIVPPEFFTTVRMPLLEGRAFNAQSADRHEVIISRSLTRLISPNASPLGMQIRNAVPRTRGEVEPWQTVVGVVPDAISDLAARDAGAALFRPMARNYFDGSSQVTLIVRLRRPYTAVGQLRPLTQLTPGGSQPTIIDIADSIRQTMAGPLFVMRILAAFALLGVVLAAVGLFGVIAYGVAQRTREIGVRMTLGATRASIARLVVGEGLRLSLFGIIVGLAGAAGVTRLIRSQLYGVSPLDLYAFATGALLLLVIAAIACIAPMLHATRVDPAVAVRSE
jgi:putative ABC transport system permease protein